MYLITNAIFFFLLLKKGFRVESQQDKHDTVFQILSFKTNMELHGIKGKITQILKKTRGSGNISHNVGSVHC